MVYTSYPYTIIKGKNFFYSSKNDNYNKKQRKLFWEKASKNLQKQVINREEIETLSNIKVIENKPYTIKDEFTEEINKLIELINTSSDNFSLEKLDNVQTALLEFLNEPKKNSIVITTLKDIENKINKNDYKSVLVNLLYILMII